MTIRLGPFSAVLWIYFLWIAMAFWIADVLGIRRGPFMWLYMACHAIALNRVSITIEKELTPTDPDTGLSLKVKLTAGRKAVLATIAILWITEYVILLRYFPSYITGNEVPGGPFTVLVIPLLIVATIVEAIWTRRIDP